MDNTELLLGAASMGTTQLCCSVFLGFKRNREWLIKGLEEITPVKGQNTVLRFWTWAAFEPRNLGPKRRRYVAVHQKLLQWEHYGSGDSYEPPVLPQRELESYPWVIVSWVKENSQTFPRMLWMKGLTSCLECYHGPSRGVQGRLSMESWSWATHSGLIYLIYACIIRVDILGIWHNSCGL